MMDVRPLLLHTLAEPRQRQRKRRSFIPVTGAASSQTRKLHRYLREELRRLGKAVKLDCSEVDILVSTYPSCDPTDVQQDSSEFYWASPVHPCPSGVQLPVNADTDDQERSESVLELLSVSDVSSLQLPVVNADPDDDPEPSCTSVLDPEPAPDLELMSFSGLSSLTPDSIQDDPDDPSSVPDFAESPTKKKKKDVGAFLRRKWRAMRGPAVEKQSRRRVKKDISSFIQRTWKTIKVSALGCYGDDTVDPDPADLQPQISVLSRDLTEPGPSHCEISSDQVPFSGPSGSQSSFFSFDSSSAPSLTDLLSELSILMGDYEPVSS